MAAFGKSFTPTYHHDSYPAIEGLSAAGKVVFITGGGRGIGKEAALSFAKAGARAVIITGRSTASLESAKVELEKAYPKVPVRTFAADVVDAAAVNAAFKAVQKEFRQVDVLISNAGILPPAGPVLSEDPIESWKGFEVNIGGTINVVRAFLEVAPKEGAVLINVSTAVAHLYFPGGQAYGASKAAVITWLDYIRRERTGLRVINIHPGVIETDMGVASGFKGQDTSALPANFQVWLTTPEADFLNGKMVWANWDKDELLAQKKDIIDNHKLEMALTGYERYYY
jgi:NAD(P)-dependent dehydrogenase (short-subunit alcohol dehydrogenase family)